MTPWREMLIEASRIGLPPEAFWRLSVREWRMLTAPYGDTRLGRLELEALLEGWPDE